MTLIVIDIGESEADVPAVLRAMDGDGLELTGVNGWHVGCRVAGIISPLEDCPGTGLLSPDITAAEFAALSQEARRAAILKRSALPGPSPEKTSEGQAWARTTTCRASRTSWVSS